MMTNDNRAREARVEQSVRNGIHLVWSRERQVPIAPVVPMTPPVARARKRQARRSQGDPVARTILAGAALLAPTMYVGHLALRWMHVL